MAELVQGKKVPVYDFDTPSKVNLTLTEIEEQILRAVNQGLAGDNDMEALEFVRSIKEIADGAISEYKEKMNAEQ